MTGLQPVPSLTERRKAATQLEISRRAAELFSARGASAVTAEEIAAAAGIGLRTFYRYFRTKEEAVAPLLAGGVTGWIAYLTEDSDPAAGSSVRDAIESATRRALTPADDVAEEMLHSPGRIEVRHDCSRFDSACGRVPDRYLHLVDHRDHPARDRRHPGDSGCDRSGGRRTPVLVLTRSPRAFSERSVGGVRGLRAPARG
ncbi:putative TetR family transcriptional regulator [Prescottella equi 103S]|uniref:TetR family transcriptional regulator n=1 Tax=Rhodococcus hoagii (strain 103S) TaxID=685727 RepID=A0A3S5Y271_RHOH1|nr:putative TetR family transcriptional regulator [Prescottella equi 103S]